MRIASPAGTSLDLRVIGYQFPEIENKQYDSNWLVIEISVVHPDGKWIARDPSLLTTEAFRLANWLNEVGSEANAKDYCSFIEPNLEFRKMGSKLRVYFDLELRPPWSASDFAGKEDVWLEFLLADIDLAVAAAELREQLSLFPERAVGTS